MGRRVGRRRRPQRALARMEAAQRALAAPPAAQPLRTALLCAALFVIAFLLSHWVDSLWEQQEDAYITYHYAQRLAAGHGFTFRDGALPSYGTTTPLWTLILAAFARLGMAPHLAAPWLTSVLHGAAAVMLFLTGQAALGTGVGLAAGAMWAVALAVFFRVGGMETALAAALTGVLAWVLMRARNRWAPGAAMGLLLLVRPDMLILAGLVTIAWALQKEHRRLLLPGLGAIAALYVPWAIYALATFDDIVPASLRAKMLPGPSGHINLASFLRAYLPGAWGGPTLALGVVISAVGAVRLWTRAPGLRPLIVWVPYYYAIMAAGAAPDFAWYYVPPLWVVAVLAPAGLQAIARATARAAAAPAFAALAAALVVTWGWHNWQGVGELRARSERESFHHHLARQVRAVSRPGDLVAATEVGNLAYWSERPVLDLLGLTAPEVLPWLRRRDVPGIISRWRPRFVVITGMDEVLEGDYEKRIRLKYRDTEYVIWEYGPPAAAARPSPPKN